MFEMLRGPRSVSNMRVGRLVSLVVGSLVVLSACGSDDSGSSGGGPTRSVSIQTVEYAFQSDDAITISAGETIEFVVSNIGAIDHEMEVLTNANRRLGRTERIEPGRSDTVTVTFDEAGVYRVICDIDDHRSLGQVAEFTVVESPAG